MLIVLKRVAELVYWAKTFFPNCTDEKLGQITFWKLILPLGSDIFSRSCFLLTESLKHATVIFPPV